jgi:phosphatidylglycerol:prolipoprotein diacylglycerol transferase
LFKIGPLAVHSYGLMLALAFLVGIAVATRRGRRVGLPVETIPDLSAVLILCAVVGSRLLYVAFHREHYRSLIDVIALWEGGATLYGGFLLAVLGSWLFARRRKVSFWLLADVVAPSIALGLAITRVGCFLSGCCFGKPTGLPWGTCFPPRSPAGTFFPPIGAVCQPIHPTQLYASLYGLAIFAALLALDRRLRREGSLFGAFLVLYGSARFGVDFLRYYEPNAFLGPLTFNQWISLGGLLFGVWLIRRRAPERPRRRD